MLARGNAKEGVGWSVRPAEKCGRLFHDSALYMAHDQIPVGREHSRARGISERHFDFMMRTFCVHYIILMSLFNSLTGLVLLCMYERNANAKKILLTIQIRCSTLS